MRDIVRVYSPPGTDPHTVDWVVDWAQKLTLRDLCIEYAMRAEELYAEADQAQREGTRTAWQYADVCRARADAYLQACAMIHQTVESRWPDSAVARGVTPRDMITPRDPHVE